jgi:alkylation response protein AidB-like acyl-CoA dehydrogenase
VTGYGDLVGHLWPDVSAHLPAELLAEVESAAAQADLAGELAKDSLERLRAKGWTGLPVPVEFGGAGIGVLESCAVQRALGAADPGLAIALTMHISSVGLMAEHWRRNKDAAWLLMEAIATQNRVLASAFAEPNLGGSVSRSTLRARRVAGGWTVSGRKTPCSLSGLADLVLLHMQTADEPAEILDAVLPTSTRGISVQHTWNTLGMRASASNTFVFDEVFVPDLLMFHRAPVGDEDDDLVAAGVIWFCLTSTAVYLGLAEAALAEAAALLGTLRIAHLGSSRAELPSYQGSVGEQVAALANLEAACSGLARQLDDGHDPKALLAPALAVKQQTIRVVPAAVATLMETCGGRAYGRDTKLERLWRDAQAVRFHPPSSFATNQYLGRRSLGLPAGLDLDEAAPGLRAT